MWKPVLFIHLLLSGFALRSHTDLAWFLFYVTCQSYSPILSKSSLLQATPIYQFLYLWFSKDVVMETATNICCKLGVS